MREERRRGRGGPRCKEWLMRGNEWGYAGEKEGSGIGRKRERGTEGRKKGRKEEIMDGR